jgi:hypothetical protein
MQSRSLKRSAGCMHCRRWRLVINMMLINSVIYWKLWFWRTFVHTMDTSLYNVKHPVCYLGSQFGRWSFFTFTIWQLRARRPEDVICFRRTPCSQCILSQELFYFRCWAGTVSRLNFVFRACNVLSYMCHVRWPISCVARCGELGSL